MKKFAKKLLATTMAACFTVAIMGCENCGICGTKQTSDEKCPPSCAKTCGEKKADAKAPPTCGATKAADKKAADK